MNYFMKRTVLLASFSLFAVAQLFAQDVAKGIIYEDANKNGKFDKKEKGIANVAVSNGVQVVLTNAKGEYVLPIGDDNIIFVITPSGYAVPKNQNNLPQFYYIHNPNGAPNLAHKGVAPTGKIPKSVDFGLLPAKEDNDFKIIVFGDPQVSDQKEIAYFQKGVIDELKGAHEYAFGISLGDLVFNKPNLFDAYIDAVKEVGIPWYQVMGNHDINFDVDSDSLSDVTFKAHFGPNNYSFNKGKVHFIVLDDVFYQGQGAKKPYIGGLRKDQLDFVENDLKFVPKDHLVVLCMHIPLVNNGKHAIRAKDNERLFSLLKDFPYTFSMSAHTHYQKQIFIDKSLGWAQEIPHHHYNVGTTSGNWYSGEIGDNGVPPATMVDGTKKGYATVSFQGNQYVVDYHVSGAPKDFKMDIFMPKVVQKRKSPKASIYVNYFLGGEKDQIDFRVDNGDWQQMKKTETYDPSLLLEVMKWDTADDLLKGSRPSSPSMSSHIWVAPLPSDLTKGKHQVQFRLKDMFGRTHLAEKSYEIK